MDTLNQLLLVGALLMFTGILLGAFSSRVGIPFLLVFLITGMLAGEDGPGGIVFNDHQSSLFVGNLALAIILLDGGLRTRHASFRVALKPALALASLGVVLTAGLLGAFSAWALEVDWRLGLLLGAIVSSTDAAAVFALLKSSGTRLNDRVASTLEIESGINDPAAIFLTLLGIQLIMAPEGLTPGALGMELLRQFGLGAVGGVAGGWLLGRVLRGVQVGEGLHAILLCSAGVLVFSVVNLMGGSGFLAVYLVGLLIGNQRNSPSEDVLRAMDGMAWLSQSAMFLILGLLVTPSRLDEIAMPAVAIALFLMLVARPLAVWAILAPLRFARGEIWFISWVGLRGAVPIVLAIFPLMAGVPQAGLVFNVAFVIVLMSLLFQGTSIPWVARRLGVSLRQHAEPLARYPLRGSEQTPQELLQFRVEPGADVEGVPSHRMEWPAAVDVVSVLRRGERLPAARAGALQRDDIVLMVAPAGESERLSERFRGHEDDSQLASWHRPGDLQLDADAPLADVLALYGGEAEPIDPPDSSLEQAILRRVPHGAVEGDWVRVSGFAFRIVAMEGGRIRRVDLLLNPPLRRR
jgi:cell volume regulation protein A